MTALQLAFLQHPLIDASKPQNQSSSARSDPYWGCVSARALCSRSTENLAFVKEITCFLDPVYLSLQDYPLY